MCQIADYNHYEATVYKVSNRILSIRHNMIIFPNKITTESENSIIYKYNYKDRFFDYMLETNHLNIGPILPMPEKELRNRLQTILVFS